MNIQKNVRLITAPTARGEVFRLVPKLVYKPPLDPREKERERERERKRERKRGRERDKNRERIIKGETETEREKEKGRTGQRETKIE